jgi:predicted transposase YbfD/YdcC
VDPRPAPVFLSYLEDLPDPRTMHRRQHRLVDIITIALCGVLSGADSWMDIANYGRAKEGWLRTFLELPYGIPSHDTMGRVFSLLDPDRLEAVLVAWVRSTLPAEQTGEQVIAVDGKTVRRSHDRRRSMDALHLITAWATDGGVALGQRVVPDHTNEITALPDLLETVAAPGTVVTLDAMGCQREVATTITAHGGDYVLALKGNQPELHAAVVRFFQDAQHGTCVAPVDTAAMLDKGHGRIERRTCWATADAELIGDLDPAGRWPGLRSVAMVRAERIIGEEHTQQDRYYLSRLPAHARRIGRIVCTHWQIENELHWVLDVVFDEDQSRIRIGSAQQQLAMLRRVALSLLKQDTATTASIKGKRKRAGWDDAYLFHVLTQ